MARVDETRIFLGKGYLQRVYGAQKGTQDRLAVVGMCMVTLPVLAQGKGSSSEKIEKLSQNMGAILS